MDSIMFLFQVLAQSWTFIVLILLLIFAIYKKIVDFTKKSKEEKLEIIKKQIAQIILGLVTEAEMTYDDWVKAGEIKRAQVISEIYLQFPFLEKIADQESIIKFIDVQIDNALVEMRKILEQQKGA